MYLCRPLCWHISVFLVGSIISNHRCQDYEKYSGWTNIAEVRKGKCERTTRGLRKRTSNVTSKIAMVHLGCKQGLTHWWSWLLLSRVSEQTSYFISYSFHAHLPCYHTPTSVTCFGISSLIILSFVGTFASCRHPKPGQFLSKKQGIPTVVSNPSAPDIGVDSKCG